MAGDDEEANALSRFGWFSAGALTALVALGVFLFAGSLFHPTELDAGSPPTIIEGR